jgi:hypothetical protein
MSQYPVYIAVITPWLIVLILLWALLVGEPTAAYSDHQLADARATENTTLRATVYARPLATPACFAGTRRVDC